MNEIPRVPHGMTNHFCLDHSELGYKKDPHHEEREELCKKLIEITGTEFLLRAHVINPASKKILLTGQADEATVNKILEETNLFHFMTKPWNSQEMKEHILGFIAEVDVRH